MTPCTTCEGTGWAQMTAALRYYGQCATCRGSGWVYVVWLSQNISIVRPA